METERPKSNARETLTDLVLEFLEAAVHEFLFAWHVYPKEAFELRVLYGVPIHMCRHPLLCEYIHSMLVGCRGWLLRGEVDKLCVILLSEEGRVTETLVIAPGWSAELMETAGGDEELPLPLTQLEEVFRAELVALVAAQVSSGVDQKDSSKLHTFRILVQTVEDAANRETAVNEEDASNSWVLADPFWCEDQKKPKEIFPLKAIQEANAPVRLNMYLEKPQKVSVTEVHDK